MGVSLRSWPIRTRLIAGASAIGLALLLLLLINIGALVAAPIGDSTARLARANLLLGLLLLGASLSCAAMFWISIAKPFVKLCGDAARAARDEAAGLPKPDALDELGGLQASVCRIAERLRDGSATAASLARGELSPARGEGVLASHLDQTMQGLRSLFAEFARASEAARKGQPVPRIDDRSLRGAFRDAASDAHALLASVSDTQSMVLASARALAQGDAPPPIAPTLSGDARKVLEAHGQASQASRSLAEECTRIGRAIPDSKGRARVSSNKYTGVYKILAEAFNQGLDQQALLAHAAHAELRAASHKLTANLSDLAETVDALRSVAAASTHRASSVGRASMDVVIAVRKTCDSLRSTSDAMNAVSTATEQLSTTVTRIASDTETARSGTVEAVHCSRAAKARVGALERAADDIGIVTEAIAEISAQTNLLALNATIEAVRAGASGRGFAVVAKEIKDLAQQTASATEDIRLRVESIRASTKATVDDIDRVLGVNSRVDELVGSIASAIEQQSVTTKEIARHISETSGQIGDVTREARHGERIAQGVAPDIAKTATTTQEMGAILTKMGAKSQTLTELATELGSTVDALSR